jgi:hypothetical protein
LSFTSPTSTFGLRSKFSMTALQVVMTISGCLISCPIELTTTSRFISLLARSRRSALTAVDSRRYSPVISDSNATSTAHADTTASGRDA